MPFKRQIKPAQEEKQERLNQPFPKPMPPQEALDEVLEALEEAKYTLAVMFDALKRYLEMKGGKQEKCQV